MTIEQEFEQLGKELLKHKYLYYIEAKPIIGDYEYDMLEKKYSKMAEQIKEEPKVHLIEDWDNKWAGAKIDFPHTHVWAQEIIDANKVK